MLLLYVLQLGGYSNQRRSNPYPPTGDLGFLQNCQGRSPGDPCINLMFTPNVEPYTTFVKSMIELNKERSKNTNSTNWLIEDPLSDTNFLPSRALGAVPVPSADFIYDYTLKHRNVTKWGIVFNKTETPASAPGGASTNFQYQVWFNGSQSGNGTDYFGRQALTLVTLLDSAIISYTNDPSGTKYVRVNPRMQDWPRLPPDQIADTVVQNLGTVFFFCATMVIFINVVNQIVNEKELKLRAGMEMMGLIPSAYWISHFLSNSVIIFVSSLISCLLGLAFQFSVFKQSSFAVPFITFFLFGEAMVMFAFFITTLVRSARVGVLISIFLFIIGLVFEGFVFSNTQFAYIWWDSGTDRAGWLCFMFFPPFNFGKMFTDLNVLTTGKLDQLTSTYIAGAGFPWSALYDPVPDSQLPVYGSGNPPDVPPPIQSWYFLIMNCAFFGILTWYLDAVVPTEYGSVYPPWFFLTPNYWGLSRRRTGAKDGEAEWLEEILAEKVKSFTGDDEEEEDDVAHERKRALDPNYVPAVKIVNLRKAYGSGNKSKIALRSLALTFHEGKCLAVVGQNGAGKTSAINILCGLTPATGGDALMYGLSVKHDMSRIRKLMGVCPQHDILFDDLTAREHITLYARLKGVPIEQLPALIEARLKAVRLWKVADQRAGAFSGGMKRRLSMVISTIGDPKVIFMDEPTTGMDPVNRRKVWQFIEKFKANRVIVLTTHAMEEAEVLGDQIAIMAAGRMRAIGNPIALKSKYGAGYRMSLLTDPARLEEAKTAVATVAPEAELEDDAAGALIYRLPPDAAETGVVPRFIKWLDSTEGSSVIKSWGISQTSLEEVFLRLLRDGGLDVFKKVREQQLKNANADAASTQVSVPIPPEGVLAQFRALCYSHHSS
ncbi:hypothetical protein BJ742DRAFT_670515 [Cladochytrium replicatum]|nr:hypothetical protein BJ742DRAFT_670515 [Cladochytrium replicatum]